MMPMNPNLPKRNTNGKPGREPEKKKDSDILTGFQRYDRVKSSPLPTNLMKGEELGVPLGKFWDYKEFDKTNYRLLVRAPNSRLTADSAKKAYQNQIKQELRIISEEDQKHGIIKNTEQKLEDTSQVKDIVGMASAHGIRYRQCCLGQNSQVGTLRGRDADQMLPNSNNYRTSVRIWSVLDPGVQYPHIQLLRDTVIPATAQIPTYGSPSAFELSLITRKRFLPNNPDRKCYVCRSPLLLPQAAGESGEDLLFCLNSCVPARFHPFLPISQKLCPCSKFELCIVRSGSETGCARLLKAAFRIVEKDLSSLVKINPEQSPDFEKAVIVYFKLKYHKSFGLELESFCRKILATYFFDPQYDASSAKIPERTRLAFAQPHSCQTCEVCVCMEIRNEQVMLATSFEANKKSVGKKGKARGS